ncbi:MAG TPA: DegV family protein [candidate division Zixibacteria bacterium]|nr:DegV family protein [candidate division Zixibacteria bacterium]
MSKVAIVTDGVNDLPGDIIEKYGILCVPTPIFVGEEAHKIWHNDKCTIELDVFRKILENSSKDNLPKTSIPKLSDFSQAFEEALKKSDSVIAIVMSSGLSGTVQAAQNVVNNHFQGKDITIFDTKQTMTGVGIQVLEAAKMAEEGKTKEQILTRLEAINPRVRTIFVMNDLSFLYKGGRIGRAKKLMASAFDVIPVVQVKDGIIDSVGSFKGEQKLVEGLKNFCTRILEHSETNDIFINHINQLETTQAVYDTMIKANNNGVQIHFRESGAILGVYSGPKTICVSYIGNFDEKWLIK